MSNSRIDPRLFAEACRALAAIAATPVNGNSEPDDIAAALDDAKYNAGAFFRLNGLDPADYGEV